MNRYAPICILTVACTITLALVFPALAQTDPAEETRFRLALPGYEYSFPEDHASHPDFRTEWWYFVGHLQTDTGRRFGYELCFFRHRLDDTPENYEPNPSRWAPDHFYFAHLALTDVEGERFLYDEQHARPAVGLAGASATDCLVWVRDWRLELINGVFHLNGDTDEFAIDLELVPRKPPVINGVNGVSQKSEGLGDATHYYSMTRLETTGTLNLIGDTFPVMGLSWCDREFGSNQLAEDQIGWNWFSLQLDNNTDIMLYEMRREDDGDDPSSSGTWTNPDATSDHLTREDFSITPTDTWTSPHSGGVYPSEWDIELPGYNTHLKVVPLLNDQELTTAGYWEGAVRVEGVMNGTPVTGQGYVELVGYTGRVPL